MVLKAAILLVLKSQNINILRILFTVHSTFGQIVTAVLNPDQRNHCSGYFSIEINKVKPLKNVIMMMRLYIGSEILLVKNLFLINSRAGCWGSFSTRVNRKRAEISMFWEKRLDLLLQMVLSFFTDVILGEEAFFFTTTSVGGNEENKDNTCSHTCYIL